MLLVTQCVDSVAPKAVLPLAVAAAIAVNVAVAADTAAEACLDSEAEVVSVLVCWPALGYWELG